MIFKPKDSKWTLNVDFPLLKLGNSGIQFVKTFKYLGHIINNSLNDDEDISREIRNTFARTNTLLRKFSKCSTEVKSILFKSFCICFYDINLWKYYSKGSFNKFRSCYNKCVKIFFGFKRHDSLTEVLHTCHVLSFDTIVANAKQVVINCIHKCACINDLVKTFNSNSNVYFS